MWDAVNTTIFTPYIASASSLFGVFIGAYISRVNLKRQEFNKAAAEFRCAFTDEIRLVEESTMDTNFTKIFIAGYICHRNAVIRFQAYLSKGERTGIKKAWDGHCKNYYPNAERDGFTEAKSNTRFMHYEFGQGQEHIGNGEFKITEEKYDSFERTKKLATDNLEKILSFAKFK